ncbi:hypothetical protein Pint_27349 [Pistacia integerrima]|uniref:Uncharacterized protein n=1 Tax=Pistacia integerrima TaxID=434235 RepID=A0ACC0YQ79_9ROSI|nr:hypothetical protein Pint_27349 [Pistacia integerrima]
MLLLLLMLKNIIGLIIVYLYLAVGVYISIIRRFATVISVIEDLSAIKAMIKSKNLIKCKIGVAFFMYFVFGNCFLVIGGRINRVFSGSDGGHLDWRNGVGISFLILLKPILDLVAIVVGTVIYFSCKSHEVTMKVLTTQSHQMNFKSTWWSVLDPLTE